MTQSKFRVQLALVLLVSLAADANAQKPDCNAQRWAETMEKFRAADQQAPPPKGAVLFVGSSSIRLWDLEKWFPERTTINRGFGGSEICDSTHYFNLLVGKHRPKLVVMYAGDNDIAGGKSAATVHKQFREFVEKFFTSLPETPLVYIAIKPSAARWKLADKMKEANALIEADCKKDKLLSFVDVWQPMLSGDGKPRQELFRDDGLHLNKKGYELWTALVERHIAEALKQGPSRTE